MALPTLQRKLFENDGYGPNIKDERLSTDITVKDWDASHDYPANVLAKAGGDIYRSVAASGPGTSAGAVNPTQDAGADYWEVFGKGGSVPVGTVIWLSTSTVPVGFLLCNGQAVGRTTYPDLFGAIGTTYGAGDGSTTFNLPNLIDKFAEGSTTPGTVKAAGLPNITGRLQPTAVWDGYTLLYTESDSGAFYQGDIGARRANVGAAGDMGAPRTRDIYFSASKVSSVYGNSNTVQPPALTLLPCIKAYSDVDNLGSLDVAQLENYVQNNFVHLTGDESISGLKTFTNNINSSYSWFEIRQLANMSKGANGEAGMYFIGSDKNSNDYCAMSFRKYSGNENTAHSLMYFNVRKQYSPDDTQQYSIQFQTLGKSVDGATFGPNSAYDNKIRLGQGGGRWQQLYAGTTTIATSDERLKTSISPIPDEILDVWGSIEFSQYQFKDAFEEKGVDARLHSGLIAQHIDAVFKANGLDASRYGLFCFDSWEAEPERLGPDGRVESPAVPAGDRYSLRYEEALCMEAAYQRRRADRAEARIASLEARLAALEARLGNSN